MKLLTKTSLFVATLSVFLFFIIGIVFFQLLKSLGSRDLDEELQGLEQSVSENMPYILENDLRHLPGIDSLALKKTYNPKELVQEFRDTMILDRARGQYGSFRIYSFPVEFEGKHLLVELYRSTTPSDKIVERVTLLMTLIVVLFLTGIFILNKAIFSNLWKDFFETLEKLKTFHVSQGAIDASESDIREFKELNKVIEKLTRQLSKDFSQLREYTDNTLHELQTPLSVIKTKSELLLQSDSLAESEAEVIHGIYRSADHLSRLNATLAMITRIENQQYSRRSDVKIGQTLDQHLDMLSEIISHKKLKVNKNSKDNTLSVSMDPGLADVLIINLLKNAIIHNRQYGRLNIELAGNRLSISNSGEEAALNPEKIFQRFIKGKKSDEGFGLGLSLVRNICDHYGYKLAYKYHKSMHVFTVEFINQE